MKLNRFYHICERDYPEFLTMINECGGGDDDSDAFNVIRDMIQEYKCSYIVTRSVVEKAEYEFLFRRYTIELLKEHKEFIYFKLIL